MVVYYAANGFLCLAFAVIYVWSSELFPTCVRGRVMGYASLAGRFGAILAPFVVDIGATRPALAIAIFAAPCLATGVLDLLLPETRGRRLPDTFEDMHHGECERSSEVLMAGQSSSQNSGRNTGTV
mmetsp:Transcript_104503/g.291497  ORF Transcript_104503/g.291497 Transcript_104503/m.291497 type:complete len:126 (-) Transcript_104503:357-734(-)